MFPCDCHGREKEIQLVFRKFRVEDVIKHVNIRSEPAHAQAFHRGAAVCDAFAVKTVTFIHEDGEFSSRHLIAFLFRPVRHAVGFPDDFQGFRIMVPASEHVIVVKAAAACRENASRISDHLRTEFRRTGRICGVIPAADFLCPPCPVIHFLHIQEIVQIGVRDCVIGGTPRRSCEPRRRIIRDLRHDIDSAFGEFLRRQTACLPPDGTAVPGLDDTASSERFLQDIAELAEHPCGADGKKGAAVRDFAVDSGLCIEIRFAPPLFSGEDPCGVQRDFRVIPCSAQGFVRSVFFFQPFSESGLE